VFAERTTKDDIVVYHPQPDGGFLLEHFKHSDSFLLTPALANALSEIWQKRVADAAAGQTEPGPVTTDGPIAKQSRSVPKRKPRR
jgi:hypothetical protein